MSLSRRSFLKQTGTGSLAVLGSGNPPAASEAEVNKTEPMTITQVEAITFRKDLHIGGGSGGKMAPSSGGCDCIPIKALWG